jgi:tetratricopeptide (TPR) repeat protein
VTELTPFRSKLSLLPNEFRYHIGRIPDETLQSWQTLQIDTPFNQEYPIFFDVSNALLDTVETEQIIDPEFVWVAIKAAVMTGQLSRGLDITWKYQEPYIRGTAAFAQALRGQTSEALALIKAAEKEAEKTEDLEVLIELLGIKAFTLTVQKNYQEAIGCFIKGSQLATTKDLEHWLQLARLRNAYSLLKLGYISDASVLNNRALTLANQSGDRFFKAQALIGIGHCLDRVGKTDDAIKLYHKAIRLTNELHASPIASIALNRVGMAIAWRKKQLEEAIDYFRRAIASAQEAEWLIYGPMANLAIIKKMQGEYFEAQELFEGVKDRSGASGDLREQISAYINLSELYDNQGDKQRAEEYKKIAQELAKILQTDFNANPNSQ